MPIIDIEVSDQGSLVLFEPQTEKAKEWLEINTEGQWWCGRLACDHSRAEGLIEFIQSNSEFTVGRVCTQ